MDLPISAGVAITCNDRRELLDRAAAAITGGRMAAANGRAPERDFARDERINAGIAAFQRPGDRPRWFDA